MHGRKQWLGSNQLIATDQDLRKKACIFRGAFSGVTLYAKGNVAYIFITFYELDYRAGPSRYGYAESPNDHHCVNSLTAYPPGIIVDSLAFYFTSNLIPSICGLPK